jgi:uncharacterized protein YjcR
LNSSKALQKGGRPILRHKNKGGAPRGNRNARNHGLYSAEMKAQQAEVAAMIRQSKSLLLLVERILRKRHKARAMRAAAQAFTASPQ